MNPQNNNNYVPRQTRCSSCRQLGHNRRSCDVWRVEQARLNALGLLDNRAQAQLQAEALARNQATAAAATPMCRGELNEFNTHSDEIHTQLTTFIEAL